MEQIAASAQKQGSTPIQILSVRQQAAALQCFPIQRFGLIIEIPLSQGTRYGLRGDLTYAEDFSHRDFLKNNGFSIQNSDKCYSFAFENI
jgi:hypothetical protein